MPVYSDAIQRRLEEAIKPSYTTVDKIRLVFGDVSCRVPLLADLLPNQQQQQQPCQMNIDASPLELCGCCEPVSTRILVYIICIYKYTFIFPLIYFSPFLLFLLILHIYFPPITQSFQPSVLPSIPVWPLPFVLLRCIIDATCRVRLDILFVYFSFHFGFVPLSFSRSLFLSFSFFSLFCLCLVPPHFKPCRFSFTVQRKRKRKKEV